MFKKLARTRLRLTLPIVFIVFYLAIFLAWPAEKYDQTSCNNPDYCLGGTFTSVAGGGLHYLTNLGNQKPKADDKLIVQFNINNPKISFSFAPLLVVGISALISLGVTAITYVVIRKLRRDYQ